MSDTHLAATLLAPRSVAIVGASDDTTKTASRPLRYLRQGGYEGDIYPVARRATVLGERAWPSLSDLPACPDHAFILLPTDGAVEAVGECVRLGVPAVTVLANGFSEVGPEGAAKEARMKTMVRGSRTRLLGPNSLGLANLRRNFVLTANAAFAEADLPRGGLFLASQSGSLIGAFASRGKARGIGFAGLVSVGGEADLSLGEICAATLDDPEIEAYLLFLETIRDAAAIRAFALGAAARNKPVVAYKLGRSAAANELAVSHTGALVGEDDLASAFLADCGIARVETLEALMEAPPVLRRLALGRSRAVARVGVVTTTGGGAAMVVDQLALRGVEVMGPSDAVRERMAARGVEVAPSRIADLTLAGARYEIMRTALEEMLADPAYDLVVAVPGSSARFQPELAVRPALDLPRDSRLAMFVVPEAPEALAMLAAAGLAGFRTPESCADAIAAGLARRDPARAPPPIAAMEPGPTRLLDELQAYALLARLGVPHAACMELNDADTPLESLSFPVAVKVLSDQFAHKSDIGGVALGVGRDGVAQAAARVRAAVAAARPDLARPRILVQAMVGGVGEALVGYRVDPQVGPVVLLAAGGVATELYRDRSVRLAPVDVKIAREMIDEVKGFAVLKGFRGRPPGDLDALAQAVVALSRLALHPEWGVSECEINPLMVGEAGVVAVDAVAWVAAEDAP